MLPAFDELLQGVTREYLPPDPKRLQYLPSLGSIVRLPVGGPLLVVVGVPPRDPPWEPGCDVPDWLPIGVMYSDSTGRIFRTNVPFSCLCER